MALPISSFPNANSFAVLRPTCPSLSSCQPPSLPHTHTHTHTHTYTKAVFRTGLQMESRFTCVLVSTARPVNRYTQIVIIIMNAGKQVHTNNNNDNICRQTGTRK